MRLAPEAFLPVDDVLVLQSGVMRVEVARASSRGGGVAFEVHQVHQPRMHLLATRHSSRVRCE